MILLEGADLVGKTTLAHKLVERLNSEGLPIWQYHHHTRPPDEFRAYIESYQDSFEAFSVQDRGFISAYAYHNEGFTEDMLSYLCAWHSIRPFLCVVVTATAPILEKRYAERELERKEMFSIEDILRANDRFWDFWDGVGSKVYAPCMQRVTICAKKPYIDDNDITNILARYRSRAQQLLDWGAKP